MARTTEGKHPAFYQPGALTNDTLTKREICAFMCLQGMLSNPFYTELIAKSVDPNNQGEWIAQTAAEQADIMIEYLNKTNGKEK